MTRTGPLIALGLLSFAPPGASANERCASVAPATTGASLATVEARAALAHHWAPLHHQGVERRGDNGLSGRADQITRVDFDGDFRANNNWENASRFAMPGAAYQSVVETSSHWFITYMFFHARDWASSLFDTEHENDSEGVLLAIARDGTQFGALKAAVTVAHSDFFSFLPRGSDWSARHESIDGTLELDPHDERRPLTTQEAAGHPLKAWRKDTPGQSIVYRPTRGEHCPSPQHGARSAPYVLLDLFQPGGLWDRNAESELFASFGSFAGDREGGCGSGAIWCTTNAANAPWGWDDHDDGPVRRGDIAIDPVKLVDHYFDIPEPLSRVYTYNPYRRLTQLVARPLAEARRR